MKSKSMTGNKSTGTLPELLVRKVLREAGFGGYRLNWKGAPGKPDICYPGRKIAIFINGCFWHRCPMCNPSLPKSNIDFWQKKFRRNMERDAQNNNDLREMGWSVMTVWECELSRKLVDIIKFVQNPAPVVRVVEHRIPIKGCHDILNSKKQLT